MLYVFMCVMGLVAGGFCVFMLLANQRKRVEQQQRTQDA